MQKTMLLWDNAHYTQNDNHALSSWCFKKKVETLEPWLLLARLKTRSRKAKHVPELLVLKTDVIIIF